MKRIIFLFLLSFIPISAFANKDGCMNNGKYAHEYKTDKRCYVTDKQKQQKPYNATVRVKVPDTTLLCTGTIVNEDDELFVYTAKHCTIPKGEVSVSADSITIMLENGVSGYVSKYQVGDFYYLNKEHESNDKGKKDANTSGDLAIYSVPKTFANQIGDKYVEISNKFKWKIKSWNSEYDARLLGYGNLKIMSDKEIDDFKQKYVDYLKNQKDIDAKSTEPKYGFSNGGVYIYNKYVGDFLNYMLRTNNGYYKDIFNDSSQLKVSYCKYSSDGYKIDCQAWGGNSGGGIFDENGNIMAIHTRGKKNIGGSDHALAGNSQDVSTTSIFLLTSPIEKITECIGDACKNMKKIFD